MKKATTISKIRVYEAKIAHTDPDLKNCDEDQRLF